MTCFSNQPSRKRTGKAVTAWVISIALHSLMLIVFYFVRFSNSPADQTSAATPTARLNQIKKLTETNTIMPKPKIKKTISRLAVE